jgi:hypothetical protein
MTTNKEREYAKAEASAEYQHAIAPAEAEHERAIAALRIICKR